MSVSFTLLPGEENPPKDIRFKLIFKASNEKQECKTIFTVVMKKSGSKDKIIAFGTCQICPELEIEDLSPDDLKRRTIWKSDVDSPNDLYRVVTSDQETLKQFVSEYSELTENLELDGL